MSLNKFMHPRNRYKASRPDFEALGKKYPDFRMHLIDNAKGKPVLDFQNPEALKVLTVCMLKEDYGLTIELPPDRLVPTLPLRLNYIHWIEDITKDWNKKELNAIDIGTGACCVYPILSLSTNPWRFLATESDDVNFSYASKNLLENKLTEKIKVVKVAPNIILEGVIGQTEETYDFSMCNPPFFADHFEAQGLVCRSPSRPDAKTMSTASPQESIVEGGEVAFVRKMIEESNFLEKRIRVYTTMLGKKSSLAPLKEILRRNKITNFASTEFCQGKTMRWGLAWTFDNSVTFPKSPFVKGKKEGKKSVVHIIPTKVGERREPTYDLVIFFKQIFSELKIHFREGKQSKFFALLTITAAENTWIHSRRKRREMMRGTKPADAASHTATAAATSAPDTDIATAAPDTATAAPDTDTATSAPYPDTATAAPDTDTATAATDTATAAPDTATAAQDTDTATAAPDTDTATAAPDTGTATDTATSAPDTGKAASDTGTAAPDTAAAAPDTDTATTAASQCDVSSDGASRSAVSELCDGAKKNDDGNGSVPMCTAEADADMEVADLSELSVLPSAQLATEAGTGNKKRKPDREAEEPSNSPPSKRTKVENKSSLSTNVKTPNGSNGTPPKSEESQEPAAQNPPSFDVEASNGANTSLTSSEGEGVPASEETNSSATEVPPTDCVTKDVKVKDRPPAQFVLKCHMSIRVQESDLAVELTWLDGQDIQLMHQLMQFFKNRLAQRKSS